MKKNKKNILQRLTDVQVDILLGLVLLLGVAVFYYFQWAYYLTGLEGSKVNIDQPDRYFWWANDSRSYRSAADWLMGLGSNISISRRPWLYPLMLGLFRSIFGGGAEDGLWIAQFLMWLGSGALIYMSIRNTTRSNFLGMAGGGFFFSHPSPLILTFHGMTETLNVLLISAFCWVLTSGAKHRLYIAILLIALATVTKPIYVAFLIVVVVYTLFRVKTTAIKQAGLIALLLMPIWIQLFLSFIAAGTPTLSTIGSHTFKNYLVADVYIRTEETEWRETMALIKDWDLGQQLTYLWEHQRTTLLTVRSHLIDSNLWVGSFFTLGAGNRMTEFAVTMNSFATFAHLIMMPLVLYYLLSKKYVANKETIALLYTCFVLQFLTSFISSGQDDRLMITALPLWIIAYATLLSGVGSAAPKRGRKAN